MKLTRGAIALYVGLVFASGAVLGAFVNRAFIESNVSANTPRNPAEFRKRYMTEMRSRLKLTDQQAVELEAVLEETRAQFNMTRASIEPEMQRIRQEQQDRIVAILKPEQLPEWEQVRRERDERIRRRLEQLPPSRR